MVPSSFLRQTPAPLHISTARAKPPSRPNRKRVCRAYLVAPAVPQVRGHGRRVHDLAGVHDPLGSNAAFSSRNADNGWAK